VEGDKVVRFGFGGFRRLGGSELVGRSVQWSRMRYVALSRDGILTDTAMVAVSCERQRLVGVFLEVDVVGDRD
jgi:hypothetical protein